MTVKSPPMPGFSAVFLSWGARWFGGAESAGGWTTGRERVKLQPCMQRLACKRELGAQLSPPKPSDLLLPLMHHPPHPTPSRLSSKT